MLVDVWFDEIFLSKIESKGVDRVYNNFVAVDILSLIPSYIWMLRFDATFKAMPMLNYVVWSKQKTIATYLSVIIK